MKLDSAGYLFLSPNTSCSTRTTGAVTFFDGDVIFHWISFATQRPQRDRLWFTRDRVLGASQPDTEGPRCKLGCLPWRSFFSRYQHGGGQGTGDRKCRRNP
jgi:hypothetical protein